LPYRSGVLRTELQVGGALYGRKRLARGISILDATLHQRALANRYSDAGTGAPHTQCRLVVVDLLVDRRYNYLYRTPRRLL
jgi:hypothetical protein